MAADSALIIAKQSLLDPFELDSTRLEGALSSMLTPQIDYAELYFQQRVSEGWSLEEGIAKGGSFSHQQGVAARVLSGEQTGLAYADDLHWPALEQAANAARALSSHPGNGSVAPLLEFPAQRFYASVNPLICLDDAKKIALLQRLDSYARARDPRIKQVMLNLGAIYEVVFVIASDGTQAADVRPMLRFICTVIAEENGRREEGRGTLNGRFDYDHLLAGRQVENIVDEAVDQAITNLRSIPAPAGTMTVVMAPGWSGVLLHEAIGHGLEGDFNRRGTSTYSGRLGERIASPECTIVDDGTVPDSRGSLNIDDEGTPTQCTTLIDKGILVGYMQDKLNARLMGSQPTGNGRRESYQHQPMPRMTNTYMLAGAYAPEEILRSVERGVYIQRLGGGQVDIVSGKFVFEMTEAYLIENGQRTQPIKGATLVGNGPDVLRKVSMVGNDLKLAAGTCGKDGQSVPVGLGQPTIRIDGITVGGTA